VGTTLVPPYLRLRVDVTDAELGSAIEMTLTSGRAETEANCERLFFEATGVKRDEFQLGVAADVRRDVHGTVEVSGVLWQKEGKGFVGQTTSKVDLTAATPEQIGRAVRDALTANDTHPTGAHKGRHRGGPAG
jgi:hypothetical protein